MKTRITKHIVLAVLLAALFAHVQAQSDTVRGRQEHYIYYQWYDTCDAFFDSSATQFILSESPTAYYALAINRIQTPHPIAIKGMSVMIVPSAAESDMPSSGHFFSVTGQYLPEYLILIQQTDTGMLLLDSLRWDTIAPKVMHVPLNAYDTTAYHYCYLYEAHFDKPVQVDSTFYIGGTSNSNRGRYHEQSDTYDEYYYKKVNFVEIQQIGTIHEIPCVSNNSTCIPRGISEPIFPDRSSNSLRGPFFALADFHDMEVLTSDTSMGSVRGSGRYSDITFVKITAVPDSGYRFLHWNDGNEENPRWVYLTQDTQFTAYFVKTHDCQLAVDYDHSMGHILGTGIYQDGDTATLRVQTWRGYTFCGWENGDTSIVRRVRVMTDTLLSARFARQQGIEIPDGAPRFTLTPNPARKQVTVQVENGERRVESGERRAESGVFHKAEMVLRDAAGHEVLCHTLRSPLTVLPVEKLPAGVYFATLYWNGSPASTQRLVLER